MSVFPLQRFERAGDSPSTITALQEAWNLLADDAQIDLANWIATLSDAEVAQIVDFPIDPDSTPEPVTLSAGQLIQIVTGGGGGGSYSAGTGISISGSTIAVALTKALITATGLGAADVGADPAGAAAAAVASVPTLPTTETSGQYLTSSASLGTFPTAGTTETFGTTGPVDSGNWQSAQMAGYGTGPLVVSTAGEATAPGASGGSSVWATETGPTDAVLSGVNISSGNYVEGFIGAQESGTYQYRYKAYAGSVTIYSATSGALNAGGTAFSYTAGMQFGMRKVNGNLIFETKTGAGAWTTVVSIANSDYPDTDLGYFALFITDPATYVTQVEVAQTAVTLAPYWAAPPTTTVEAATPQAVGTVSLNQPANNPSAPAVLGGNTSVQQLQGPFPSSPTTSIAPAIQTESPWHSVWGGGIPAGASETSAVINATSTDYATTLHLTATLSAAGAEFEIQASADSINWTAITDEISDMAEEGGVYVLVWTREAASLYYRAIMTNGTNAQAAGASWAFYDTTTGVS